MYGPEAQSGSLDDEPFVLEGPQKDECMKQARDVVRFIQEILFPMHGIRR
jgi:hypothetical protein